LKVPRAKQKPDDIPIIGVFMKLQNVTRNNINSNSTSLQLTSLSTAAMEPGNSDFCFDFFFFICQNCSEIFLCQSGCATL